MSIYYTKPIQDKLMADFRALTYFDSANLLFADVSSLYAEIPENKPVAEVQPSALAPSNPGISDETRSYTFAVSVYDSINAVEGNEAAQAIMDRMCLIKDVILRYVQIIPNPLEHAIEGIHIYDVSFTSANIDPVTFQEGVGLMLTVNIVLKVNITNRLL